MSSREFFAYMAAAGVVAAGSVQVAHLIDVVIYRGSDTFHEWVLDSLQAPGLTLDAIALYALLAMAGWLVVSAAPGRMQQRRAAHVGTAAAQGDSR